MIALLEIKSTIGDAYKNKKATSEIYFDNYYTNPSSYVSNEYITEKEIVNVPHFSPNEISVQINNIGIFVDTVQKVYSKYGYDLNNQYIININNYINTNFKNINNYTDKLLFKNTNNYYDKLLSIFQKKTIKLTPTEVELGIKYILGSILDISQIL